MARNVARRTRPVCIRCFHGKKSCIPSAGNKLCGRCSNAQVDQTLVPISPSMYHNETFQARALTKLQEPVDGNGPWLQLDHEAFYVVQCHPITSSGRLKTFDVSFTGTFDITNLPLVKQLDEMVREIWTPNIVGKNEDNSSIPLACLCIGYLNVLFLMQLLDESIAPYQQHNLPNLFAHLILARLDALIIRTMESVRNGRPEMDKESRPGLYLLYLYLSDRNNKVEILGDCAIFDDQELGDHVRQGCITLGDELEERMKIDCKNKFHWSNAFTVTKTELQRDFLRSQKPRRLCLQLSECEYVAHNYQRPNYRVPTDTRYKMSQDEGAGHSLDIFGSGPAACIDLQNQLFGTEGTPPTGHSLIPTPANSTGQDYLGFTPDESSVLRSTADGNLLTQLFQYSELPGSLQASSRCQESTPNSGASPTTSNIYSTNTYKLGFKTAASHDMAHQSHYCITPRLICGPPPENTSGMSDSRSRLSDGSQREFGSHDDGSKSPYPARDLSKSDHSSLAEVGGRFYEDNLATAHDSDGDSITRDHKTDNNMTIDFAED